MSSRPRIRVPDVTVRECPTGFVFTPRSVVARRWFDEAEAAGPVEAATPEAVELCDLLEGVGMVVVAES